MGYHVFGTYGPKHCRNLALLLMVGEFVLVDIFRYRYVLYSREVEVRAPPHREPPLVIGDNPETRVLVCHY